MPNYAFRCSCGEKRDEMMSYEESITPGRVLCNICKKPMTKFFGKSNTMMIVPAGKCGNAWNGYTSFSQTKKGE